MGTDFLIPYVRKTWNWIKSKEADVRESLLRAVLADVMDPLGVAERTFQSRNEYE